MAGKGKTLLAIAAALFVLGCAQLQYQPQAPPNATQPVQGHPQLPQSEPRPSSITTVPNATEPVPPETPPAASQNISSQSNASNESAVPAGLQFGNYSLVLEDLVLPAGQGRTSCASLAIYGLANATLLGRLEVCPGESAYWAAPDGRVWRIAVYQTAPGYAGSGKWAEMGVFG